MINKLREITNHEDWWYIYGLRNSPEIRKVSVNSGTIPPSDHLKWIQSHGRSKITFIYDRHDVGRCGVLSINLDGDTARWSFYVDPRFHGLGYGNRMLSLGLRYISSVLGCYRVTGDVKIDNLPSQRLHEKLGFTRTLKHDNIYEYAKVLDEVV